MTTFQIPLVGNNPPAWDIPNDLKDIDYKDEDVTFVMHVYSDYLQTDWVLSRLRMFYPGSRIIVISDGDEDIGYRSFISKYNAEVEYTDRLFLAKFGARLLHKRLELFMRKPSKYLIKIDADTGIHRRLKYIPKYYPAFGSVRYSAPYVLGNIQGGCVGINLATAQELYESKAFLDPNFPIVQWKEDKHRDILICEDVMFSLSLNAAEIYAYDFPEVRSTMQYLPNKKMRHAITHPNKGLRL